MRKLLVLVVALLAMQLAGCAAQQSLTQAEIQTQNKADAAVAGILFENNLDQTASYHVHPDGSVVIKFADSVSSSTYNKVVDTLRANPAIHGVRAEQNGVEVCSLSDMNPR
ncbi:hypothetical protein [Halothiobacillus diazotrophicus]|nr:hypothetical protein [Halothiobacillus diazotrophicus]